MRTAEAAIREAGAGPMPREDVGVAVRPEASPHPPSRDDNIREEYRTLVNGLNHSGEREINRAASLRSLKGQVRSTGS
jgi:hypothetical protein